MKKILFAFMLIFGLGLSEAQAAAPAWACSLNFRGQATGVRLVLGFFHFNGRGTLGCVNANGRRYEYPVLVTMRAAPISPGISLGSFRLRGSSADISLFNTTPRALFGAYSIAQAEGAIIGGAGVITAVKVGAPQLAIKVSLQFASGLGFNIGLNQMYISLDRSRLDDFVEE